MGRVVRDHVLGVGDDGEGESVRFKGKKISGDNKEVRALESVLQDLLGAGGEHGEREKKGDKDVKMKDVE